jgi:branched-chain amino acid transport system permease protein
MSRAQRASVLIAGALVLILALLPLFTGDLVQHLAIVFLIFTLLSIGWNLVSGYAGQFSFGHATFFGIGAYATSLLYVTWGITPWVGMLVGGFASIVVSLGVGYLCFRYGIRHIFFALLMYATSDVLRIVAVNWRSVTKGSMGVLIPLAGNDLARLQFQTKAPYLYISLVFVAAALALSLGIERSALGYYLRAVRDDETAASSLGVNITRYKLMAMALSAFVTSIAGTLYMQYFLYIDPGLAFGAEVSLQAILPVLVGGPGSMVGPVLGSLVMVPLSEVTRAAFRSMAGMDMVLYGVLVIVIILFFPRGIYGYLERTGWLRPGLERSPLEEDERVPQRA